MKFKFQQITSTKYTGPHELSLRKASDGSFYIFKNGKMADWGVAFQTIHSAETFLSERDYIKASTSNIGFNTSDIEFIQDMYGKSIIKHDDRGPLFDVYAINDKYSIAANLVKDPIDSEDCIVVNLIKDNDVKHQFTNMHRLLPILDNLINASLVAITSCNTKESKVVSAAKNNKYAKNSQSSRRTARDIVRDLVRVKSSNVWAYGIEIKDRKDKMGDVYVQFKGKNGGPGAVYRYFDVPLRVWRQVLSYPSKGAAIWKFLRNNFKYSKLTGDRKGKLPNAIN